MKKLHILVGGTIGGIEKLCINFGIKDQNNNVFYVIKKYQPLIELLKLNNLRYYSRLEDVKLTRNKIDYILNDLINICNVEKITAIIIHHPCIFTSILVCKIKKLLSINVFIYGHAAAQDILGNNRFKYILNNIYLNKAFKKCDNAIMISNFVSNTFNNTFKCLKNKTVVIYNGIILENFVTDYKTLKNPIKFVYIGRIVYEKGIQNTLFYLSKIPDLNFTFDIIGDGDYLDELKRIACDYKIEKQVRFLGYNNNVIELLKNYDAFVHLPEWDEGFCISLVEAMASGLLCFVNSKGALTEIVSNNYNGFIIKDTDDFLKILKDINLTKFESIRNNAILDSCKYSIDTTLKEIDDLIKGGE